MILGIHCEIMCGIGFSRISSKSFLQIERNQLKLSSENFSVESNFLKFHKKALNSLRTLFFYSEFY